MISRKIISGAVKGTLIAAATVAASFAPAAAATNVTSNSTGLIVNLKVANAVAASVGPVAQATSTKTPGTTDTQTVASASANASLGLLLSQTVGTGVITDTALSTGTNYATATSTVNNLSLGGLLGFGAGTLTSTTTYNNGVFTGTSSIANLDFLTQLVYGLSGNALVSTTPNFVVANLAGISIIANEQVQTSSLVNNLLTQTFTTNALHISFNDLLSNGNLLTGDIIVAQSQASAAAAVPEPATWAMMITGFGAVGTALRRRKRIAFQMA